MMTIAIARSNNKQLRDFPAVTKINKKLTAFLSQDGPLDQLSDSELIKMVLKRVFELESDSLLSKSKGVKIFKSGKVNDSERCDFLVDCFAAVGLVGRKILLWGPNSNYSACEVWSDFYKKWIFVDPRKGIYCTHKGKPLSYYALWSLKRDERLDEVVFATVGEGEEDAGPFYKELMSYMSVGPQGQLALFLDQKGEFCSDHFEMNFVSNPHELYYPVNRVLISHQLFENEMRCRLHHNMPWFSFYELFNEELKEWTALKKPYFSLSPVGEMKVRAVNKLGRKGQITQMDLM